MGRFFTFEQEETGAPLALPAAGGGSCRWMKERLRGFWSEKLLVLSFVINLLLLFTLYRASSRRAYNDPNFPAVSKTPYAKLERNNPVPIMENTPYSSHNLSEVRQLWEDINIDDGMVALPDDAVSTLGVPVAQRYPWDQSKGLYFLNGYHNLHCLRAVHIALMEFAHGEPQSRRFQHVLHCMESLRQDILCNADDTPRYTTNDEVPESGVGQVRMCRNWGQLEDWGRQHNACYHFINQTATGFPNVLRYTYCPPGSPDAAEVKRVMGGTNLTDLL